MGAGELSDASAGAHPLLFFSVSGAHPLESLREQLTLRGLHPADLLRVRVFAKDSREASVLERELETLLPAPTRAARTVVALPQGAASQATVDAMAAPRTSVRNPLPPPPKKETPSALRLGPWVFVGALTGDPHPELALPERIEVEARELFARMESALRGAGAQLRDLVKVGGWLTFPMRDYPPLGRVREDLRESRRLLPASSAVQVGAIPGDRTLAFEAVAYSPEPPHTGDAPAAGAAPAGGAGVGVARAGASARPSPLAPYYATARSAGGYVLSCGEIPRSPGAIEEQLNDVYEQLTHHLREHRAGMRNVVQQTVFVRNPSNIPTVERELLTRFGDALPLTTLLPVSDMGFREGVDVEVELIAERAETGVTAERRGAEPAGRPG